MSHEVDLVYQAQAALHDPVLQDVHGCVLQDLINSAAEQGSPEVIGILLDQPLFKKDKDELDEAVDTGESTVLQKIL
jgi:hypothetical protein